MSGKKNVIGKIIMYAIIALFVITLVFTALNSTTTVLKECVIIDIIDVSAGGFGSQDKCLFNSSCGKISVQGDKACNSQISDRICLTDYKGFFNIIEGGGNNELA